MTVTQGGTGEQHQYHKRNHIYDLACTPHVHIFIISQRVMTQFRHEVKADRLQSTPLADGDGFGGPSVTASRYGHCHPSLINNSPRSGGRREGCLPCAGRSEETPADIDQPCGAGTRTGRSSRSVSSRNVVVWVTKPAAMRLITCDLHQQPLATNTCAIEKADQPASTGSIAPRGSITHR